MAKSYYDSRLILYMGDIFLYYFIWYLLSPPSHSVAATATRTAKAKVSLNRYSALKTPPGWKAKKAFNNGEVLSRLLLDLGNLF